MHDQTGRIGAAEEGADEMGAAGSPGEEERGGSNDEKKVDDDEEEVKGSGSK